MMVEVDVDNPLLSCDALDSERKALVYALKVCPVSQRKEILKRLENSVKIQKLLSRHSISKILK